jgi:hypothetical protein
MSRSNPTTEKQKNPCTRWHEWSGGNSGGMMGYYDREQKKMVEVTGKFAFIVLDELATIKGWHDASDSGISANEVRDTKSETLVVRAFKGGELASGFYSTIRDRITSQGGHFVANIYVAYKDETGAMKLGAVQFKGAALNAWVEFKKANRAEIYKQAVVVNGFNEGKKGSITFRTPKFALVNISPASNEEANKIDAEILQPYLADYFRKPKVEQAEAAPDSLTVDEANAMADEEADEQLRRAANADVPF